MKPPKLSQSVALSSRLKSDRRLGGTTLLSGDEAESSGRAAGSVGEMGWTVVAAGLGGLGGRPPPPSGGEGDVEANDLLRRLAWKTGREATICRRVRQVAGVVGRAVRRAWLVVVARRHRAEGAPVAGERRATRPVNVEPVAAPADEEANILLAGRWMWTMEFWELCSRSGVSDRLGPTSRGQRRASTMSAEASASHQSG